MTTEEEYKQRAELAESRVAFLEQAIMSANIRLGQIRWDNQGVSWENTPDAKRFNAVYETIMILRDALKR